MASESTSPSRPVLTLDDLAQPLSRRPDRLYSLSAAELSIAFSQGLDLAEGKAMAHAQRVAYIATSLGDAIAITPAERTSVFFGALLHDAGAPQAAAFAFNAAGINEASIFGPSPLRFPEDIRNDLAISDATILLDAIQQHCRFGGEVARALELPDEVAATIESHHERWDGHGVPNAAEGSAIPIGGRLIAVADVAESLIANELSSLTARRNLGSAISRYTGSLLDPELVDQLLELARGDAFWLGLYSENLVETLLAMKPASDGRKSRKRLARFAEVFADLAGMRSGHPPGHFRRIAENAQKLAEAVGLDVGHVELIRIAALLHDVGLFGVPARVMSKPDILSVAEMQIMRQHPVNSEMIVQDLVGFEEIGVWISRHHERPDGKGYPEMLTGDEIPLESRILAVADVHAALTASRPHRSALGVADARQILVGAAGTQLDPELVHIFCSLL